MTHPSRRLSACRLLCTPFQKMKIDAIAPAPGFLHFRCFPPAQGTAPRAPPSSIHLSLALSQGASLPTATPSALCQRPRGPGRGRGRQPGPQGRGEGPQLRGLLRLMWALVPLFVRCLVFYMVNGSDLPIKDFRCSAGPRKGCWHSSSLWLVGVRGRDLVSVGGWAYDTRALPSALWATPLLARHVLPHYVEHCSITVPTCLSVFGLFLQVPFHRVSPSTRAAVPPQWLFSPTTALCPVGLHPGPGPHHLWLHSRPTPDPNRQQPEVGRECSVGAHASLRAEAKSLP